MSKKGEFSELSLPWLNTYGNGIAMWDAFWTHFGELAERGKDYKSLSELSRIIEKDWKLSLVDDYLNRFANRTSWYRQWVKGGDFGYALVKLGDKNFKPLDREVLLLHLSGKITISLPALDENGFSKWACWDFDDEQGDLVRLETMLRSMGYHPVREGRRSGRDGHLWLFFARPVLAADLIKFDREMRSHCEFTGEAEFFPKSAEKLSQIRAPLGVHRKPSANNVVGWFDNAVETVVAQLTYISQQPYDDPSGVERIASLMDQTPIASTRPPGIFHNATPPGDRIDIRKHVDVRKIGSREYGQCPACANEGHDAHKDNLLISEDGLTFTCCYGGPGVVHGAREILEALGLWVEKGEWLELRAKSKAS